METDDTIQSDAAPNDVATQPSMLARFARAYDALSVRIVRAVEFLRGMWTPL